VSLSSQLPPGQVSQLRRYLDHMLEVNKSMNLTGMTRKSCSVCIFEEERNVVRQLWWRMYGCKT
jgi:hypothetical protein